VWDALTGQHALVYKGHGAPVWSVAWSPDGKRLVSGTGAAGDNQPVKTNNSVRVWDATTGQTLWTFAGGADEFYALAWSPDGTHIAGGGDEKAVRIWDAATGKTQLIYAGHTDIVFTVAWSPDGGEIASASADGTVRVWRPVVSNG
jgi:WD40 repeat protein